jgi:glycosyltransferase involved in cell wall biosynthesis
MNILLLYNRYRYRGGEDTYVYSTISLLRKKGHKVYPFIKDSRDIKRNILNYIKIAISLFWNFPVEKELDKVIKEFKPDLVYSQNIYPLINPSVYHLFKRYGIPVVQRMSSYRLFCPKMTLFRDNHVCQDCVNRRFPYPSVIHACYQNSRVASMVYAIANLFHSLAKTFDLVDRWIFPSAFTKKYHEKNYFLSGKKTLLVPSYFLPGKDVSVPEAKKKDFFLFVGRLSEEKGILFLLEAFEKIGDAKLVMVGDGPLKKKIEGRYGRNMNLKIKGFLSRKKIFRYMAEARAVIVPSYHYDVLPNVLIESYANRTPVIAPDFGVFKFLLKNGRTGLFYRQGDEKDLIKKIIYLSDNPDKSAEMGDCAYGEYLRQYRPEGHYENLIKVFNKLLLFHDHEHPSTL